MIILYDSTEKDFINNGITTLVDCISCKVKRQEIWDATIEYPLYNSKNIISEIKENRILKIPTPSGLQLFRIKRLEKTLTVLTIYAVHVFFDLADNFIADTFIVAKTRGDAIKQVLNNTMFPHDFKHINEDNTELNNCRIVRKNPINAILGDDENCIIQRWNGVELEIDNFNIASKNKIGKDNGILISYGKNMTGIVETLDVSDLATVIIPQGSDELLLPEYYIASSLVNNYFQPFIRHMVFDEVRVIEDPQEGEEPVTREEALDQLRDIVKRLYNETKVDIPFFNYEINFIDLGKTEEYKQFKKLYMIDYGDVVYIRHLNLGIDLKGRILSYVYDSLIEEFEEIEIGTEKKNLTLEINKVLAEVQFTKQKIEFEVSALDKSVSSKVEIVENRITQKVENLENNTSASLEILSNQIQTKVTAEDVGTIVTQNADSWGVSINGKLSGRDYIFDGESFKIGGNGDLAEHAPSFSRWNHSDGSYTKVSAAGFERFKSGTNKTYHYIFHRGSISNVTSKDTVRIQLPEEFKGKDYGISWWSGNIFPDNPQDLLFSNNTELVAQDKNAGWFDLKASLMVRNPGSESSPNWRGKMNLMYIAIL